jgi:hypothetical protein
MPMGNSEGNEQQFWLKARVLPIASNGNNFLFFALAFHIQFDRKEEQTRTKC